MKGENKMKKVIRITALFLALLMLALPLVGCDNLDELRAKQGFIIDKDTISFNGNTYKRLYTNEHLSSAEWRDVNITEKDVPVLLSEMSAISGVGLYTIDSSNIFIVCDNPESVDEIYCRADKYEYFSDLLKEGIVYDKFCFSYYGFVEKDDEWKDIINILTDKEKAAIDDITKNYPKTDDYNLEEGYDILNIFYQSADGFFEKSSNIELLVSYSQCYIYVEDEENGGSIFSIPNKYKKLFDGMLKNYRNSMYSW
jgi:hypothetical protein